MDIAITTMSSKGQVVIPIALRTGFHEGEKLLIIKNDHQLIMKKASELDQQMEEDLEFARRTEEAWKSYDRGEFIEMDFDQFIKRMKKW